MDNKKIGWILIIFGIILAVAAIAYWWQENQLINKIVKDTGSCYLDDGTCLHENKNSKYYIFGLIFSAALLSLGMYLIYFDRSHKEIINLLERQKETQTAEEKWAILSKGLSPEEQTVMQAIKEQEGIEQNTLCLRTGMHKSKLSLTLSGLERKNLISRKDKGKTKQVFLKFGY